jgi:hypothetical protein
VKHLLPRSQQRLLSQLRSNPSELDDDDDDAFDDFPDIQVSYRRPTLIACDDKCHNQDELSDHVLVRLAIARAKAMDRYGEINTEGKG